jgi:hypothetical protein
MSRLPQTAKKILMTTQRAESDACTLLGADHKNVKTLFAAYDQIVGSKGPRSSAPAPRT